MKTNSYLAKILFCLLPAVSVNAYAKVAGSVMSSEGEMLTGASVVLVSLPDNTLVSATLADVNGKFSFDSAQPEGKALVAEFPGYEKGVCAAGEECGLVLEPKVTGLKEVEVIAKGNDVRASAGKYVYTPGDMALKMSNAYTALSISPLIKEEKNKLSIFFKEAPAIVYINGKMPKESQESVLAMLRSVPPQNIIRIEVMPNPGMSQRDAWGGIINVVLKNPGDGALGNVRYSGYMNDGRVASTLALYTAFQKDRFHSSLNIGYYGQNYRFSSRNVYNFFTDGSKASEWKEESSHKNLLHALYDAAYELSGSSTIGGGVNISDF